MTSESIPVPSLDFQRAEARLISRSITDDGPPFHLLVAWPQSYEALLADDHPEPMEESSVLEHASATGRAIISADAGSGKTWLLARLMELVLQDERALPVLIRLRDLDIDPAQSQGDIDVILRHMLAVSRPDLRFRLRDDSSSVPVFLFVDGLNEISRPAADPVIDAIDELARRYPFLTAIAADRLVRRPIDLERWQLAKLLRLSDGEVRRIWTESPASVDLPLDIGILNRPFFLNAALGNHIAGGTEAATISAYFGAVVSASPAELDDLGRVAYEAYREFAGRNMPEEFLRDQISSDLSYRLQTGGAVRTAAGQSWFTHHLLHDFLAARHLSSRPEMWGPTAFDVVTLKTASFDSLRLLVEQLDSEMQGDRLVRLIYDWSFYGAAYALVEGYVSRETRVVILAMLADKRWDLIRATAGGVTDALLLDRSNVARQLLAAGDRSAVFRIVLAEPSQSEWFTSWAELFTMPREAAANSALVARLRDEDSIASWTLANVLRRCNIDAGGVEELENIASEDMPVARWRVAHVLGSLPTERSAAVLQSLLADENGWVRYGAIRSTVELAARASVASLRTYTLASLVSRLQDGEFSAPMLRELGRALDVDPQPVGWAEAVGPLVQQLVGLADSASEQGKWDGLMARIIARSGERE